MLFAEKELKIKKNKRNFFLIMPITNPILPSSR